jgi:hypothetical protein
VEVVLMDKRTLGPWHVFSVYAQHEVRTPTDTLVAVASGRGDARLIAAAPELLEALRDMLAGWVYIRQMHGDLYGVGWDRAQGKAESAIAKAQGDNE